MVASSPVTASSRRNLWLLVLPAAVAFAYACGHLAWYRHTPLGQVPVLDEQENIAFAEAIVRNALPREPFYRAPGYALLLATLRGLGVPASGLFHVALALGTVLHAVNAALIAQIARRLFTGPSAALAALIAGLLYALHPVFVHYATQALDAVPALTFFLLGLCWIVPELAVPNFRWGFARVGRQLAGAPQARASSQPTSSTSCPSQPDRPELPQPRANPTSPWRWAGASLSWAIAVMFRPNYLMVWGVLPILAAWALRAGGRRAGLPAACAGAAVFAAIAGWQWRVSGEPAFLPSQGPYNLWAANQPGAHGRYYVQRHTPPSVATQNPAHAESIYLYRQEKGYEPKDTRALNAHWRARFVDHVLHHPLVWLVQLARKTYALLNDWEQYNNKTFAFHQARSPWLQWNPIGWGVLFILSVAGAARFVHETPALALPLALVVAACTASVVLFFVSARFRLPLAALTTIFAGGALAAPRFWREWPRRRQRVLAASIALAAAVTFSNFDRVRDRVTFVQDHALLARAAHTVGDDILAWREATATLAEQPMHHAALRIAVAAYFNQLVVNRPIPGAEDQWREICTRLLSVPETDARNLQAVAALALWRAGQTEAALTAWRNLGETPSALAARLLLNDVPSTQIDSSGWRASAWDEPLVRLAAARFNLPAPAGVILGSVERATEVAQRIFASPSTPASAQPP